MRDALREEPEVALLDVLLKVVGAVINPGDTYPALEDVRPLGVVVPVQVTHGALVEAHVRRAEFARHRKLADGDLARPSTVLESHVRVRPGPLHVEHGAPVGWR